MSDEPLAINPHSKDWRAVDKAVDAEIARLQVELEDEGLDHAMTQFVRGKIALLRRIKDLPETNRI
jgi:hypothetical protein